ncbi:MAG: hypothetical protein Kow00107_07410 [Planctomycetota bacterium]
MSMRTANSLLVLVLLLIVLTSGCSPEKKEARDPRQIRIGALVDLTGTNAVSGQAELKAMGLAIEKANDDLLKAGREEYFTLFPCDTHSVATETHLCLRKLLMAGVNAVVGPSSDEALIGAHSLANREGMLVVAYGGGSVAASGESDCLLRSWPTYDLESRMIVDALQRAGVTDVVVIRANDKHAVETDRAFSVKFLEEGGKIAYVGDLGLMSNDLNGCVAKAAEAVEVLLENRRPTQIAVLLLCGEQAASVIDAAIDASPSLARVKWFGGSTTFFNALDSASDRVRSFASHTSLTVISPAVAEGSAVYSEIAALVARPDKGLGRLKAFFAYDATRIACHALAEVGFTPYTSQYVKAAVAGSHALAGATGDLRLTKTGDRANALYTIWRAGADGANPWIRISDWTTGLGGTRMLRSYESPGAN